MKNKKFNKKRYNRNIKSIYPYNDKGALNTNNPYLQKIRYDMLVNKKNINEMIKLEKEWRKLGDTNGRLDVSNKINELSLKQIEWLLSKKNQLKKFYNYLSIDKKSKNMSYYNSFGEAIYFPYSAIGNKYQSWYDEFYDWVSELPSIYNWSNKQRNAYQSLLRFMDEDEFKTISENNRNINPSWSKKGDVWNRFELNPLYDGKDYVLTSTIARLDDVIWTSMYRDEVKKKETLDVNEGEYFLRKNAKLFDVMKIVSKSFKDCQMIYPFIKDGYRLDKNKTSNGFENVSGFLSDYSMEEIEKYGIVYNDDKGNINYLTKNPKNNLKLQMRFNDGWIKYFERMILIKETMLKNSAPFTTFYQNQSSQIESLKKQIEMKKKDSSFKKEQLVLVEKGDFKILWRYNDKKTYKYPYIQYGNGMIMRNRLKEEYSGVQELSENKEYLQSA